MQTTVNLSEIPVFYTPAMAAKVDSFSPSPRKPEEVMKSWLRLPINLWEIPPKPVSREHFYQAHDRKFVDEILDCKRRNGFGHMAPEVAKSLPYTTGAMLDAARAALGNGRVAVAPVSGFHHACWDYCSGFCTFNGLMVTACTLHAEGVVKRIGILDFDQHWGDGTHDIITRIGAQDWIEHYSPFVEFGTKETAKAFIYMLPTLLEAFRDVDLILYQAGADPHVDDPLGGWLTTDQLYDRDWAVFQWCKQAGIPVAWNLAGGYQEPLRKVLTIHDNTMLACAATFMDSKVGPAG